MVHELAAEDGIIYLFYHPHYKLCVKTRIEGEPGAGGQGGPYRPHHGRTVQLIEGVLRIKNQKSPLLIIGLLIPHEAHDIDAANDP